MEQSALTSTQRQAMAFVAKEPNLKSFYLTGGTALAAYYLGHRISEDLDFFSFTEPDMIFIHEFANRLKQELSADSIRYERLYDRNQFYFLLGDSELKIEFTKYPFPQLEQPAVIENISVDSQHDIAANKLMTMLDRFDPKDFVDLYFLLQERSLSDIRGDAERKFGMKIDSVFLGGELMKARRIEALPKMLKPISIEELKSFFMDTAKGLAPEIF